MTATEEITASAIRDRKLTNGAKAQRSKLRWTLGGLRRYDIVITDRGGAANQKNRGG